MLRQDALKDGLVDKPTKEERAAFNLDRKGKIKKSDPKKKDKGSKED